MPTADYERIITALWQQDRSPDRSFADQRTDYVALGEMLPPPVDAHIDWATDAPTPSLRVRMPGSSKDAVVIWFHGGGYVIGSPRVYRRLGADLSAGSAVTVLVPDYRLAPEDPFPAALDDAVTLYSWLLEGGVPFSRVILGGDSAGGGLAVATLVALRDRGVPLPAGAVLLSPFTDLTLCSSSWDSRRALDPLVGDHNAPAMVTAYLNKTDAKNPLASPVYADVRGLPPLLILVGDHEVLLDDSTTLTARARSVGVDVELGAFDGLHHIWPVLAPDTAEGKEATDLMNGFIRRQLFSPTASRYSPISVTRFPNLS